MLNMQNCYLNKSQIIRQQGYIFAIVKVNLFYDFKELLYSEEEFLDTKSLRIIWSYTELIRHLGKRLIKQVNKTN